MAYTRVNWQNSPSHATPLSAENLNVMDAGIASLDTAVTEATGDISTLETEVGEQATTISGLQTTVGEHTADIQNAQDDISGLQTTVSGHTTSISGLQTTVSGHTTSIGTLANLNTTEKSNLVGAINEVNEDVSDLKEDFAEITDTTQSQVEKTSTQKAGLYIGPSAFGTAAATVFFIKYISVEAGKTYRVLASPIKTLSDSYGLVAFSANEPGASVSLSVLVNGSTTETSVDYSYTPQTDGYICVATMNSVSTVLNFYEIVDSYHVITDKTLSLENVSADAEATGDRFVLLGYTTESEKSDVIALEHDVLDRYITSSGKIASAGSNNFSVAWYPVSKGKSYTIKGIASVGGSGQALICFDNVYDSTVNHVCKTVIQTATTTDTEYNIDYSPSEDGYIVMPSVSKNKLVVTLVSDTDFQRIYDIEKSIDEIEAEIGKTKMPIKIQLFGDSITDNKWGDKITWANYIPQNLSEYNVTVVNDAVGGSGIGHGASKGTTESHQEEDYNFVHDLVTDGTTLQTDANYVVILVGTNNWASGTDLGDMSSTGTSTIYGALKGIVEYISEHSKATIFVCTIPQRYNSADESRDTNAYGEPLNADEVSLADYCEAFRKVSAFYGMPCVHLNEALGWNRLNISNFCGDGLHPNVYGDKMISAFICNEIKKHIGQVSYT